MGPIAHKDRARSCSTLFVRILEVKHTSKVVQASESIPQDYQAKYTTSFDFGTEV